MSGPEELLPVEEHQETDLSSEKRLNSEAPRAPLASRVGFAASKARELEFCTGLSLTLSIFLLPALSLRRKCRGELRSPRKSPSNLAEIQWAMIL
jgi:hypothetical protein